MGLLHELTCRRHFNRSILAALSAPFLAAPGGRSGWAEEPSPAAGAGAVKAGAAAMPAKSPVEMLGAYLNGIHFYADDLGRQIEATHYCAHLSEDFFQCVIYDSNRPDAKLIGVEYIVTERVFQTLPEDEKKLWHSHHYEVQSGALLLPGIPEDAEHAMMTSLVSTYGKTWHCWQIDKNPDLPLGIPQLMMGFTKDGQVHAELLQDREKRLGISAEERRKNRAEIPMPKLQAGANAWESGRIVQLRLEDVPVRNLG